MSPFRLSPRHNDPAPSRTEATVRVSKKLQASFIRSFMVRNALSVGRRTLFLTAALILVPLVKVAGQAVAARPQPRTPAEFRSQLDSLVGFLMRDVGARGAAVALIEGGQITLQRAYGFADAERQERVTLATTFNAASVTKAVTAWGVLRLADEGKYGLNDPVFNHVKRWKLPPAEWPATDVTIARILSHTAGLSHPTTGIWFVGDEMPSLEAALSGESNGYGDTRLVAQPGTRYAYSGGGYSILQLLLEEASGTTIASYMERAVLRPLGMNDSEYGWTPKTTRTYATPYSELGVPARGYRTVEVATGALNLTIGDLARFAAAHAGPVPGRGVLRPETFARMIAPAPATGGVAGLGLAVERVPDGRVLVGHDGGNPGWGATFRIDPATGNGIAILVNRSWGSEFYYQLLCSWRNATGNSAQAERCGRNPIAAISTVIVERGLAEGRQLYEELRAQNPSVFQTALMERLARRMTLNNRHGDAIEILRWNVRHERSVPRAHEVLGDALLRAGDTEGARESLSEALKLDPGNQGIQEKLLKLPRHPGSGA